LGGTIAASGTCCCSAAATGTPPPPPPIAGGGANAAPTAAPPGPAAALAGQQQVEGVDVSDWQGDIDWKQVHDAGISVAYLKATEGKDFVASTFAKNREGTAANGIVSGAYDFAKPGSSGGDVVADAQAEAKHFLDTAGVKPGDLIPALDLEDAGNLNGQQLAQWVQTWADTVKAATGVTPIVYSSPSFWNEHVDNGGNVSGSYKLWVANWGTDNPTIPNGWQAWNGWQYTSDGEVAGINGRVDRDKFTNPAELVVPG
jgi:GH25 family lysozyme M1 (1,4-beta-N-acetylmuramidase)